MEYRNDISKLKSTANNLAVGNYTIFASDGFCTAKYPFTIKQDSGLTIQSTVASDSCNQGVGAIILNVSGGAKPYKYNWTNGLSSSKITNLKPNIYNVTVLDSLNCPSKPLTFKVTNNGNITAAMIINPTNADISKPTIQFYDNSKGTKAVKWLWNFGDSLISYQTNPEHDYANSGTYVITLNVTDNFGCKDSVISFVTINDILQLFIPNSFTPNNDRKNDLWIPKGNALNQTGYDLRIFDRWGEQIFHTKDFNEGWNGRKNNISDDICQEGVYLYIINYQIQTGRSYQQVGRINLIY